MDDVDRLVRAERRIEAAELAASRGEHARASAIFEAACAWDGAARAALRAGDAVRAFELAAEAGDRSLAGIAADAIAQGDAGATHAAARLTSRRRDGWAAWLLEIAGDWGAAGRAHDRAGDALGAARAFERAGDSVAAGRALEGGLRRDPRAWSVATRLGALLGRLGKLEAAARALQRVPAEAPERAEALSWLVPVVEGLGLSRAADEARAELARLGGSPATLEAAGGAAAERLFGRWVVVREIASSPSARVLEAIDALGGERVAVKLFAGWQAQGSGRDALARFEREVLALRTLSHPSVVPLRAYVAQGPALVLAWMEGGTLDALLARTRRLAPARAVEIASAVLSALGAAHRAGIVHRDVKPANVLFDAAGAAYLGDFGVAHLGDASATATAGVFGTLAYMSPEQRAALPATPASDVYSAGLVLREMLTGARPSAPGAEAARPSAAHFALDGRHDALLDAMTAVDPAARLQDALAARDALGALPWPGAIDATVPVRRSTAPPPAPASEAAERVKEVEGAAIDTWTGRAIERVALDEATLARARAFAQAGAPALQAVLRVARDEGAVWLEALGATAPPAALSAEERAAVDEAVEALHAAGVANVDVEAALVRTAAGVRLRALP